MAETVHRCFGHPVSPYASSQAQLPGSLELRIPLSQSVGAALAFREVNTSTSAVRSWQVRAPGPHSSADKAGGGEDTASQRFQRSSTFITANLKTLPLKTHLLLLFFLSYLSLQPLSFLLPAVPLKEIICTQVLVSASIPMETQAKTDGFLLTFQHLDPAIPETSNSTPGLFS